MKTKINQSSSVKDEGTLAIVKMELQRELILDLDILNQSSIIVTKFYNREIDKYEMFSALIKEGKRSTIFEESFFISWIEGQEFELYFNSETDLPQESSGSFYTAINDTDHLYEKYGEKGINVSGIIEDNKNRFAYYTIKK